MLGLPATAHTIANDELVHANLAGKSIALTRAGTGFSSSGTYKVIGSTLTAAGVSTTKKQRPLRQCRQPVSRASGVPCHSALALVALDDCSLLGPA